MSEIEYKEEDSIMSCKEKSKSSNANIDKTIEHIKIYKDKQFLQ